MRAVLNPCKTIALQLCNTTSELAKNQYCAISAPQYHTRLIISAERIAKTILIRETSHQLTPTRDATADSTNILCENDNIIAIINTSLTVKSNEIIAPI